MNKFKFIYLAVFVFAIFSGLVLLYYLNKTVFAEPSLRSSKNPCWFKGYDEPSIGYEEIMARQNREMYGYSVDVPLEMAVNKFNEEMRCYPYYDEFSDLTEDEVIASLIDFDSHNNQPNYSESRREERKKMINEKFLPKGSLLRFEGGRCQDTGSFLPHDLCAKGLKISLILNLDKKEDVKIPTLYEDIFVIRKTLPKFQPRQ